MSFSIRFSETGLEREDNRLRLVDKTGETLLELRGHEVDDAVRAGFVDPQNVHFSMFEYAKIRSLTPPLTSVAAGAQASSGRRDANFDRSFLAELNIRWD